MGINFSKCFLIKNIIELDGTFRNAVFFLIYFYIYNFMWTYIFVILTFWKYGIWPISLSFYYHLCDTQNIIYMSLSIINSATLCFRSKYYKTIHVLVRK